MKTNAKFMSDNKKLILKITYDSAWQEYKIFWYEEKDSFKMNPDKTYFTTDEQDAIDTAMTMMNEYDLNNK